MQYNEASSFAIGYGLIVGKYRHDPKIEESFINSLVRCCVDGILFPIFRTRVE